jgi:hypothetical protein
MDIFELVNGIEENKFGETQQQVRDRKKFREEQGALKLCDPYSRILGEMNHCISMGIERNIHQIAAELHQEGYKLTSVLSEVVDQLWIDNPEPYWKLIAVLDMHGY